MTFDSSVGTVTGVRAAVVSAIVMLSTACGSETDVVAEPPPPRADRAAGELEITFWPNGRGRGSTQTWTLRCDPAGGTHPNPEDACARLAAIENPFAPPPGDEICTEQYGGPEEALVEGTYRGRGVSYGLSRTNGCQIARYDRYRFLIPVSSAA